MLSSLYSLYWPWFCCPVYTFPLFPSLRHPPPSSLFSCGTSKDGETSLVEWNEAEGAMRRSYLGFRKRSLGVVAFDSTRNRFLVAGDDFQLKFWDMDNTAVLCTLDADGGLPVSGRTAWVHCGW